MVRIDERDDGSIHETALRHGKYAVMLANAVGAVVTFSLSAWVVPIPKQGSTPQNVRENLIAFIIVLIVGMIAGTALSVRAADKASGWIRAGRLPTLDEREATLR